MTATHHLIKNQKKYRSWCLEYLYYEGKSKVVFDVIIGNETWTFCYGPLTKYQMDVLNWNMAYQSEISCAK